MKSLVVVALLVAVADAEPGDRGPVATTATSAEPMRDQTRSDGGQVATTATSAEPMRDQVRVELGAGGPGGLMAVRYSRVLPTKTRIEPAVGLGYTGVLGSLLVTQPLFEGSTSTRGGTRIPATFELYLGYSASYLGDGLRHPWVGREAFIPDGAYHWIDGGVSTQMRWGRLLLTGGAGITKLVSGPDGIGGMNIENETFWWLFPEGWFGKQHMAPSLWSSIGVAF